jgi:hypothetical protein
MSDQCPICEGRRVTARFEDTFHRGVNCVCYQRKGDTTPLRLDFHGINLPILGMLTDQPCGACRGTGINQRR